MLAQSKSRYGTFLHFYNDDPIGACLTHYGEWAQQEMDLLSKILKPTSCVIDVGANIGTHSLFFAHHCDRGTVLSFEPQPFIFNFLVTNATINNRFNVYPVKAAVSDTNSKIRMVNINPFQNVNKINYGEFKINDAADSGLVTDVVTLDNYVNDFESLDLIKIDVEGMETKVLEGAKKMLEKFKPALYLEFSEKNGNAKLIDKLESLNYKSFLHVYQKHNPENFNNQSLNVWEDDNFILTKDNMHKRYDASILCFHKDIGVKCDLPEAFRTTTMFDFLFERALI